MVTDQEGVFRIQPHDSQQWDDMELLGSGMATAHVGVQSYWFQGISDRGLREADDYKLPVRHSQETLAQLRDDLDAVLAEVNEIQRLIDELSSQEIVDPHIGVSLMVDPGHAQFIRSNSTKFHPMSDGVLVRYDESGEYEASLDGTFTMEELQARLWQLVNRVTHVMTLRLGLHIGLRPWVVPVGIGFHQSDVEPSAAAEEALINQPRGAVYTDRDDFDCLADDWERNRPRGVRMADMVMHPSYQKIIGMGPQAIPWLLERLEERGGHWFWAISAITRAEDAVPAENRGNLRDMTAAWLEWGRQHGFAQ